MSVTSRDATGAPPRGPRRSVPIGTRAGADATVRLLAASALWLGLLLVTYWWDADGGIRDLGGWVTGLDSVGRLTGLVASVLLLAQVVLMARVPRLEAAYGQDRLAHLHRLVGFTSFNLMLAHIVLITWGYAAGQLTQTPSTLWNLVTNYPGMLLATGGTVCLFLVVFTSIKAARRRIRYESWHLLHLYAYLGVGLALPHQLWTGQQFLSSPGRTVLLVDGVGRGRRLDPGLADRRTRVAQPVAPPRGHLGGAGDGRRRLGLPDRPPARPTAGRARASSSPGASCNGPGWSRANPYSLSAAPDGRSLRITVQAVGDGSASALALRPGTRALFEGPYGRLSPRARTRRGVALIGAGVGITPLRALAEGLPAGPGDCVLLHRWTTEALFLDEFDVLGRERGLAVLNLPGHRRGDGSWLPRGVDERVDDVTALLRWVPDIAERDVFVCGPERWTALVRATLTAAGLPDDRLHLETFGW